MTLSAFAVQYNLHDSLLENIECTGNNGLRIAIDFCCWQQEDYLDTQEETHMMVAEFFDVSLFDWIPHAIDSDQILRCEMVDNDTTIQFITFNDVTQECHTIRIKAAGVKMYKMK